MARRKTYYGTIDPNFIGEYPLVKLEIALGMALSFKKYALLICKGNAIGILRHTSTDIVIFDSHARNKEGLCCENGKCVLLKMESDTSVRPTNVVRETHTTDRSTTVVMETDTSVLPTNVVRETDTTVRSPNVANILWSASKLFLFFCYFSIK